MCTMFLDFTFDYCGVLCWTCDVYWLSEEMAIAIDIQFDRRLAMIK